MQPPFSGIRTFMKQPTVVKGTPDVSIVGIPFDLGTSNRPGARFGPSAIRDASLMLTDGDNPQFRLDPCKKLKIVDAGDLEIANGYLEETLTKIESQLDKIKSQIICLGGDHTITLPILRSLHKKHGKVSLVHFDAHVDTWNDNFGTPIGHGTPFHYAATENLINTNHSVQIGIRSPVQNEIMDYTQKELGYHIITSEMVHRAGLDLVVQGIKNTIGNNKVYLTFDIDGIDPSQAPGTGTPEIGGLFTWQVLYILKAIKDLNWVGMDLVEVAPAYDTAQITALTGATIVWYYLCMIAGNK